MKRPFPHHLVIATYIATPAIDLVVMSLALAIPMGAAASRLLSGYGPLVAAWMITAPAAGACLYLLNRASWYIFLAHAGIMLAASAVTFGVRGLGDISSIPRLSQDMFLAGNVIRLAFVGYVLQKDFRAPYFHILQRRFRGARRLALRIPVMLDGQACMTEDVSAAGCFVGRPVPPRGVGKWVAVQMDCGGTEVKCKGQVMRSLPSGLGVRFVGLSRAERRALRLLLARQLVSRRAAPV
jgi:PilZ domain